MVRVTRSRIADVLTGIGSARHTIITAAPPNLTNSKPPSSDSALLYSRRMSTHAVGNGRSIIGPSTPIVCGFPHLSPTR